MKALKITIVFLTSILIIFFGYGLMKPSIEYGHSIETNKPVSEVWAISQDESKFHLWLEGYKSIELTSGEKGGIGSKYLVTVNPGEGQDDFQMTQTLMEMRENEYARLLYDSEMMEFDQVFQVTPSDKGSTFETKAIVKGKGLVMQSTFAWMDLLTNSFEKQEIANVEKLKVLINENTTQY